VPGWHGYVSKNGQKERVTDQPRSKSNAKSKVARSLDFSPATKGSLQKSGKQVRPGDRDLFFTRNTKKFNKRGGKLLEKGRFRFDMPAEKNRRR